MINIAMLWNLRHGAADQRQRPFPKFPPLGKASGLFIFASVRDAFACPVRVGQPLFPGPALEKTTAFQRCPSGHCHQAMRWLPAAASLKAGRKPRDRRSSPAEFSRYTAVPTATKHTSLAANFKISSFWIYVINRNQHIYLIFVDIIHRAIFVFNPQIVLCPLKIQSHDIFVVLPVVFS
jgi:hypothetical protein